MTHAGCRISRVRPKGVSAEIVMLPQRCGEAKNEFVEKLVSLLALARKGDVRSYATVFRAARPDGDMVWTVSWASEADSDDTALLLAGIERLRARVMAELDDDWGP